MNDIDRLIRSPRARAQSRERILRYLEGEASEPEIRMLQELFSESDDWRREYETLSNYLSQLRALPRPAPSDRIWERIQNRIADRSPQRVWFPWFYARPAWGYAARILPVLLLIIFAFGVSNSFLFETSYDYIVVEERNGFGLEAESYAAYHDLSDEPLPIRDSLLAFCTNTDSE